MEVTRAVPAGFLHLTSAPGPTWRNNYREVRSIGRGSFGEATLAKDSAGNLCVMKMIDITKLGKEQQDDAVNEVKVLSSLKHPYIVRYHESFVENGTLAIVMDYAEGGDLAKRIKCHREKRELFAEGQVMRWFTQIALGLKYLHNRHILHRDLKPQNIFLTKQDDLRLGDFGISKVLGSSSLKEETTMGTPYYFSPEICREKLYSFASDIWALGCILYELAALHVPFEAHNIPCLIRKITAGRPPVMPPVFSASLRQLCHQLLLQDYNRRPSAADILQNPMIQAEMRQMLQAYPDINATPPLSRGSCGGINASPPMSRGTCAGTNNVEDNDRRMFGSMLKPLAPQNGDLKRSPSKGSVSDPVVEDNDRRMFGSMLKPLAPQHGDLKRSPSKGTVSDSVVEDNERRMPGSMLKPLVPLNGDLKRAPSAPAQSDPVVEDHDRRMLGPMPKLLAPLNCDLKKSPSAPEIRQSGSNALMSRNGAVKKEERKPAWPDMLSGQLDMLPGQLAKEAAFQCDKVGTNLKRACASPLLGMGASRCIGNRGHSRSNRRRPTLPVWQDIH